MHKVLQLIRIRSQVEEFFSLVATWRHGIAEVFGPQGLLPGVFYDVITIRTFTEAAE